MGHLYPTDPNLVRLAEWLEGKTHAPTRHSAFARLQLAAAA